MIQGLFWVLLKALGIVLSFDFCPHFNIPVTPDPSLEIRAGYPVGIRFYPPKPHRSRLRLTFGHLVTCYTNERCPRCFDVFASSLRSRPRRLIRLPRSRLSFASGLKELCHTLRMCAMKRYITRYILKTFANFFKFRG